MKPGKLFNRDYLYLTSDEQAALDAYQRWQDMPDLKAGIPELPVAVRRHRSLFPNNYIELRAMKEEGDLCTLNDGFERLINSPGCHEQQILNYINRTPAYHIVGSLLRNRYSFGHHSLFLFKEMSLGHDFRTDYILIGSGSGGFECVLVEFEGPEGRIITKGGYLGQVIRDGKNQVEDWKCWMDANYNLFSADLQTVINPKMELPEELIRYNSSRFHYVIVAGRRKDFEDTTYDRARRMAKDSDIMLINYDHLLEDCRAMEQVETF